MTYTVTSGRQILRDGIRVATVYSIVQTKEPGALMPADADDFTHEIAHKLNTWPLLLDALKQVYGAEFGWGGWPLEADLLEVIRRAEGSARSWDKIHP